MKEKKKGNYLTIKESRAIIKHNIKMMKYYEAQKNKQKNLKDYTSVMRDENNIIELDNLNTNFFTENGKYHDRQRRYQQYPPCGSNAGTEGTEKMDQHCRCK